MDPKKTKGFMLEHQFSDVIFLRCNVDSKQIDTYFNNALNRQDCPRDIKDNSKYILMQN